MRRKLLFRFDFNRGKIAKIWFRRGEKLLSPLISINLIFPGPDQNVIKAYLKNQNGPSERSERGAQRPGPFWFFRQALVQHARQSFVYFVLLLIITNCKRLPKYSTCTVNLNIFFFQIKFYFLSNHPKCYQSLSKKQIGRPRAEGRSPICFLDRLWCSMQG